MQRIVYRDPNVVVFQSVLFKTNSTVILSDDVVIVVDPAWLPHEVLEIRDYVQSVRGKRPLFLVFTHSDYDHILGYGAFQPDKVFASKAFADNPNPEKSLEDIRAFDHGYYIDRPYPITYPSVDFQVLRDGVQYRLGQTRLTFYLAPGHTEDSVMLLVWQLGLCIAGDYLSTSEFPLIEHNSSDYLDTLDKLPQIHDKNWFTRLIPGHGEPSIGQNDWFRRRSDALAYIYALRESVATQTPFDESSLWTKYKYPISQREYHLRNVARLEQEFADGEWEWDQDRSYRAFLRRQRARNNEDQEED
jgi:hydroxyacylglutathione hydrolase